MTRQFIILQAWLRDFGERAHNERGATAVEYALLVVFIALVMALGATFLGTQLKALFTTIGNQLTAP